MFIYSTQADRIVFANPSDPYARNIGKSNVATNSLETLEENEWFVQVSAESQGFADEMNFFGVKKNASSDVDDLDWYEPPVFPGGLSINFPNDDVRLAADIRAVEQNGYKWAVNVKAQPGRPVALKFENLETVPADFEILLLDETTQIVRNLRTQPQISVRVPANSEMKTSFLKT